MSNKKSPDKLALLAPQGNNIAPILYEDQAKIAKKFITAIVEGEIDPVKAKIYLKSISDTIKAITDNYAVKELIIDKAENYIEGSSKDFRLMGATVTITQKTTYDYKDDSVWSDLDAKRKSRERFLKSIPEGKEVADADTGLIAIRPIEKLARFVKISFKED